MCVGGGGGVTFAICRDILVEWAIPLFNYTPLQMTINGVQGCIGKMSRGWSFKCLSLGG